MMGGDFEHRWTQTRESIEALRELWTKDQAEYHGRYYDFPPVYCYPKPVQDPIPVILGGHAKNVLSRIIRYGDGWLPNRADPSAVEEGRKILDTLAAERGRDPSSISISVYGQKPDRDLIQSFMNAGADRVVVGPEHVATDAEMVEQLERIAEAVIR